MAWTNLSFAYGSVLTSTKMTQMYDNFAYGTGSTNPTFIAPALGTVASGDLSACTSNTESVGNNTTQLATTAFCEAGFVNNDVGASGVGMITMAFKKTAGNIASNATIAGSDLFPAVIGTDGSLAIIATYVGLALTGTWRNISAHQVDYFGASTILSGMFQRIS